MHEARSVVSPVYLRKKKTFHILPWQTLNWVAFQSHSNHPGRERASLVLSPVPRPNANSSHHQCWPQLWGQGHLWGMGMMKWIPWVPTLHIQQEGPSVNLFRNRWVFCLNLGFVNCVGLNKCKRANASFMFTKLSVVSSSKVYKYHPGGKSPEGNTQTWK